MTKADRIKENILAMVREYCAVAHRAPEFVEGKTRISYGGRVFDDKELTNLVDSALEFWLTTGRYSHRFEENLAEFLGAGHCILTNSGSSANLLAVSALTSEKLGNRRVRKGDEVITVAASFPTTVTPLIQNGLVPVFVDVSLPTYNVDPGMLEEARSDRTRAVMLAHTMGNPFDVEAVLRFCAKHDLWLIEDNCDALGSKHAGRFTGTFGHIGTQSFYPPHHITMGEGGALYTADSSLKRIIESFRDWGRDCHCESGRDNTCANRFRQQFGELPFGYDHKYVFSHFGYNLKVTDLQAAIGCAQLEKLPAFIDARARNWRILQEEMTPLTDRFILPEPSRESEPCWFGYLFTVREGAGFTRDKIVSHLERHGIQTRMLFTGNIVKHPCFDEMRRTGEGYRLIGDLSTTDKIMRDTFWIGVYPGITDKMMEFMIRSIHGFFNKR
jgi:CDP-6-deoxy-D-xylo-4-hexulose-3-dehydrase